MVHLTAHSKWKQTQILTRQPTTQRLRPLRRGYEPLAISRSTFQRIGYRFRMYIRFVIARMDADSGLRQGLFQAISDLEYEGLLLPHEQDQYDAVYEWFRENLKAPQRFSRGSKLPLSALYCDAALDRRLRGLVTD